MSRYCLIGYPLGHSMSKEIHTLLGDEEYELVEISLGEMEKFLREDYDGFNVTIPYKTEIMKYLTDVDEVASEIGAVNTVVRRGDTLHGYNTDVYGMYYALHREKINLNGKNVMILGSGGTSKTAAFLAKKLNAKNVTVVSRHGMTNYDNFYQLSDTQVIINTTPVGMYPHAFASPADPSRFPQLESVFDAVYNPLRTELVAKAKALGLKNGNGLAMLVAQAVVARRLFSDETIGGRFDEIIAQMESEDFSIVVENVLKKLVRDKKNVVLVGMPGSGKSSIGKKVARALNREFVDIDKEIVKEYGMPIPQIFAEKGEPAFREMEEERVARFCLEQGLVIATGGGAVISERNRESMRSNGYVVHITRRLSNLAKKGRPLSTDSDSIARLYEERKNYYKSVADATVRNEKPISIITDTVVEIYEKNIGY